MTPVVRFATVVGGYDDALLTRAELSRRDRLQRANDRDAYTAAHILVRECAAELCGVPTDAIVIEQRCPECGEPGHGRPYVADRPDVHVSLSHSRRHAAAIAGWQPCGIDVEDTARKVAPIPRALSPDERGWLATQPDPGAAFLRLWVRKEAVVKAGTGTLATDVLNAPNVMDWSAPAAVGAYFCADSAF